MLIYHKSLQEQCKYTLWWLLVVQNWVRLFLHISQACVSFLAYGFANLDWEPNYVQDHHVYIQFWQWCCWLGLESSVQILALLTQLSPTIFPASCSTCTYLPFMFVSGDILLEWISYTTGCCDHVSRKMWSCAVNMWPSVEIRWPGVMVMWSPPPTYIHNRSLTTSVFADSA